MMRIKTMIVTLLFSLSAFSNPLLQNLSVSAPMTEAMESGDQNQIFQAIDQELIQAGISDEIRIAYAQVLRDGTKEEKLAFAQQMLLESESQVADRNVNGGVVLVVAFALMFMVFAFSDAEVGKERAKAEAEIAKAEAEKAKAEAEKAKVEAEKAKVEAEKAKDTNQE